MSYGDISMSTNVNRTKWSEIVSVISGSKYKLEKLQDANADIKTSRLLTREANTESIIHGR
jgi:hypothetical protein